MAQRHVRMSESACMTYIANRDGRERERRAFDRIASDARDSVKNPIAYWPLLKAIPNRRRDSLLFRYFSDPQGRGSWPVHLRIAKDARFKNIWRSETRSELFYPGPEFDLP